MNLKRRRSFGDPFLLVAFLQIGQPGKFRFCGALTDSFCEQHLNDEYRSMIHRVIGVLARKRPSPLLKGRDNVWAAAAVHAVGRTNFLDDPSRLADNPMVWMLQVNGLLVDIRHESLELQQAAYEQGLIPFIPAKVEK